MAGRPIPAGELRPVVEDDPVDDPGPQCRPGYRRPALDEEREHTLASEVLDGTFEVDPVGSRHQHVADVLVWHRRRSRGR